MSWKLIKGARDAVLRPVHRAPHDRHRRNNIRLHLVNMRKAQADEILNRPLLLPMPMPRSGRLNLAFPAIVDALALPHDETVNRVPYYLQKGPR